MKTKFALLAATLFAAAMISCSKDSSGETSPEVTPSGESTYMTVDLKILGANQTRAAGSANLAATGEESAVNNVRLYVFKANNTNYILETYVDFDAYTTTKTFQITTGQKVFHALVNMSSAYPSATVGTTSLDSFKQSTINLTSIATAATDNAFWMTTLADATQTLVVATEAQASAGTYNNVSLSVGRAVAKVGVDLDESTVTQPIDGTLSGTSYKVVNNPNQMYALKVFNTLGYQLTPYYTSTYFTSGTDSFDNGSYLATTLDGTTNYHEYPSYMVENSHDVPTYGNSNVVMIKGTFTPKVLYSTDGSVSYDITTTAGLADLETTLNTSWDGTFWRTYNSSTKLYGTKFYYETPVTATGETAVKYDQGTSYYGLWLKNSAKSTSTEKYTVSRNQYWNVTITSIAGCGSNSEGGVIEEPGEENPIDENTYMMATIQVVDWEEVTQSGGI